MSSQTATLLEGSGTPAARRWAARVAANAEQIARVRETEDPRDFYAPRAKAFATGGYPATEWPRLAELARPKDTWLDVGAGAGRLAVPLSSVVRRVVAVEPSEAMRRALRVSVIDRGRSNVQVLNGRWPEAAVTAGTADVVLAAFVLFDLANVVGFLEAMERAARRRCVVSLTEHAPSGGDDELWWELHGEEQATLPALPDFLELMVELGRPVTVTTIRRERAGTLPFDAALDAARRTYWVARGSAKDTRLAALLRARYTGRTGRVRLPTAAGPVTVVDWAPA
jgi:SAM-dependent methyltransferase